MMQGMKTPAILIVSSLVIAAFVAALADPKDSESKKKPMQEIDKKPEQPTKTVEKTDAEWKKILTPEQYAILRKAGTERANGAVYEQFKRQGSGTYYCAGCNTELFTSKQKFDSHCGWPSFYDPAKAKNVKLDTDFHLGYARTEVRCANCDGHLGHVFSGEGYDTPTDKRYCINGTVLKFVPDGERGKRKSSDKKADVEQGKRR